MQKNTNESEEKKQKLEKRNNIWDWIIGVILAGITLITIPETLLGFIVLIPNTKNESGDYWGGWLWIAYICAIIITVIVIWGYIVKIRVLFMKQRTEYEYRREKKINSINKVVFDALYNSNSAKIAEIFRYTYGKVSEWNPINYRDNVLIYDVHEQIRSILKSLEGCIINIDPTRFNDRNVTVGLVYCYPSGDYSECKLPLDKSKITHDPNKEENPNYDWKLITSGDTSGNHKSVLDYLSQLNSFYVLVDSCGTVFKNDKFSEIKEYQAGLLPIEVREGEPKTCYIKDVKDWENSDNGECKGSVVGTVINIRNDNPEEIFVKAILTVTTYGVPFFVKNTTRKIDNKYIDVDKAGLSEKDYNDVIIGTIISSFSKLIETELAQMYIRHSIKEGKMCPKSGRIAEEEKKDEKEEHREPVIQKKKSPLPCESEVKCGSCESCECKVKKRESSDNYDKEK